MQGDELLGPGRQRALLDHAERIAGLGSWDWTPATGRLWWSDNHFRLYGLEPQAIEPSLEYVLAHVHPDDLQRVQQTAEMLTSDDFHDDVGLEYRAFHTDGTVRTVRVTISSIDQRAGIPKRIAGSVQDVTLDRRAGRHLAAYAAVAHALDDWTALVPGAERLLCDVATALDLAFGAFWVADGSTLNAAATWHLASAALERVDDATRRWHPGLGSGGIGRAFAGRCSVVLAHASMGDPSLRSVATRRAGVHAAFAIPVVAGDETLAVVELLPFDPIEPTTPLLRALDGIGHEIGQFLSHRRGELTAPVLTPRELQVLQLAAQGWSAASIAAELFLSPATVKRHFEHAYASLGVSDRAAAVGEAMRRGLIV